MQGSHLQNYIRSFGCRREGGGCLTGVREKLSLLKASIVLTISSVCVMREIEREKKM